MVTYTRSFDLRSRLIDSCDLLHLLRCYTTFALFDSRSLPRTFVGCLRLVVDLRCCRLRLFTTLPLRWFPVTLLILHYRLHTRFGAVDSAFYAAAPLRFVYALRVCSRCWIPFAPLFRIHVRCSWLRLIHRLRYGLRLRTFTAFAVTVCRWFVAFWILRLRLPFTLRLRWLFLRLRFGLRCVVTFTVAFTAILLVAVCYISLRIRTHHVRSGCVTHRYVPHVLLRLFVTLRVRLRVYVDSRLPHDCCTLLRCNFAILRSLILF